MLVGESTIKSGYFRALIDGKPVLRTVGNQAEGMVDAGRLATRCQGTTHLVELLATGLDPTLEHTLVIEPHLMPGQELRFESVCVAGNTRDRQGC
jgi:hypothetical protein